MITLCPACGTQFEVTEEELQRYHGQVRCGECDHIFDGRAALVFNATSSAATSAASDQQTSQLIATTPSDDEITDKQASLEEPIAAHAPLSSALYDTALQESRIKVQASSSESWPSLATPLAETVHSLPVDKSQTRSVTASAYEATSPDHASDERFIVSAATDADSVKQTTPMVEADSDTDATVPSSATVSTDTIVAEAPALSTLSAISAEESWQVFLHPPATVEPPSTARKLLGVFACLLLITVAGLQAVWLWHAPLTAALPQIQPWVQPWCAAVHCRPELARDIRALTIDDADVREYPQREGVLSLHCVLYNHASQVMAWPNIELTLTDAHDDIVVRKVLAPAEYLPASIVAEEGFKARQSFPVEVLLASTQTQMAGFRVSVRY